MSEKTRSWRERVARPLLIVGLIGGATIFLPRLMRHDVKLVPQADRAGCAKFASVSITQDGEALRTFKVLAEEGRFAGHVVQLAEGEYTVFTALECVDDSFTERVPQPLIVDRPGTVYLRIRSACACPER